MQQRPKRDEIDLYRLTRFDLRNKPLNSSFTIAEVEAVKRGGRKEIIDDIFAGNIVSLIKKCLVKILR